MDRTAWLRDMRRDCEEKYDKVWAPLYGEGKTGLYDNTTHLQFIHEFLNLLPEQGAILDAACGAGRYDGMLLEAGHDVLGIDQSTFTQGQWALEVQGRSFAGSLTVRTVSVYSVAGRRRGAACATLFNMLRAADWGFESATGRKCRGP